MPIVFDEIDGVVQNEGAEASRTRASERTSGDDRKPDVDRKLREWTATQRRRERLLAD